jgi:broad specificity phosphatase PhoE
MAAAGYPGPCGTDKRWDEFDHLALLHRYVAPERIEPALADSRVFQRLLDEALDAWTRDGGWAAFTADALAALHDVVERLPKGRDAVVVSSGGVIGALAAGLIGAPATTGIALNRVAVNGAISLVTVGGSGANLLSFNDHAHFAGTDRTLLTYR